MEEGKIEVQGENKSVVTKSGSMRLFIILGVVAVVVAGAVGLTVYRAYAQSASDKLTLEVAKLVNLPAAKVGSDKISYVDYISDLQAIRIMRDYDKAQRASGANMDTSPGADLTDQQMTDQVLWRLVNNLLVEKEAQKYGIKIEDADVKNLKNQMLSQFKDASALDQELMKRYGWTMSDYEQKVIRPFILQSKLTKQIAEDPKTKEPLKAQAQQILDQVLKGADFAALAKKYNGDSTANTGGDVGWFSKGQMVPEFEQAAFSLKKGEIYPTLVESQYGYHIIRLDDRKTDKVKDAAGKMQNLEQVRASQILFRFPDLMTKLEQEVKDNQPHLYIKVHNPFTDLNAPSTPTAQ